MSVKPVSCSEFIAIAGGRGGEEMGKNFGGRRVKKI
jgi:hypothetical protein